MNGDDNIIAVSGQCFVDRVVNDFEHHMVQTRAIRGVTDVHTRTLTYGLKAFKHFDRVCSIGVHIFGRLGLY